MAFNAVWSNAAVRENERNSRTLCASDERRRSSAGMSHSHTRLVSRSIPRNQLTARGEVMVRGGRAGKGDDDGRARARGEIQQN